MSRSLKRSDFSFDLPEELVAQYPLAERSASRLLHVDPEKGRVEDRRFTDLPELLNPGDLLVFNDTRVIPARLHARKPTGGRVEILVERVVDDTLLLAQLRVSRSPHPGDTLIVDGDEGPTLRVIDREDGFYRLAPAGGLSVTELLDRHGHMPLPPYIRRDDTSVDRRRYQTIYARRNGAVAAPTAGLHFDEALWGRLEERGIERAFVTLHVGAGTFQPVRTEDLAAHRMHGESISVSEAVCRQVASARARGGRVVAVGTTAVRALETASAGGGLAPFDGETRLFITPGYRFRSVDALITNFHMPETTLFMLVCALAGRERMLAAYRHAVEARYRFYSYGDAMLIAAVDERGGQ